MRVEELKQAVEQIEMDDISREKMIQELRMGRRRKRGHLHTVKVAAAAAVCVLALGAVSIPVRALVSSLVKERMEAIPEEEVKATVEQIDQQPVEADSFTRDYTESENARFKELSQEYMNGTFPTGEMEQVDSEAEAEGKEFCFLTTISKFYLPADRDLTDEEILEIIDFNKKRDYALQQRYEEEFTEEIAAKEAEEKKQIEENIEGGGISEEEAVDIAGGYMKRLFGVDGSGMELNHYYNQPDDVVYDIPNYMVNWSIQSQEYYYFTIDANNGKPVSISLSDCLWDNQEYQAGKPSPQEAVQKTAAIKEKAADFLKNEMEIDETYAQIKHDYYTYSGEGIEGVSDTVVIHFIKEDGKCYKLTFDWNGNFKGYSQSDVESFAQHVESFAQHEESMAQYIERFAKAKGEDLTSDYGKEITVEVVYE